ncbi:Cytochrome c biogenesis protein CcsA [Bienertia sinuspersici]
MDYYVFKQAAMVKLVDTLLLGSSAGASRFESEWRHGIFGIIKDFNIFVVITLHLMTLLVNEIVGLYNSLEKGMLATFFCITGLLVTRLKKFLKCNNYAKCYFYPSICYVGPLNSNASICNISTYSRISMVNDALTLLIIIFQKDMIRIFDKRKHLLNESFFFSEIQYLNEKSNINIVQNASPGNYYRSQLIKQLDHWSYRAISLGFIFLTIGILSGSVWANEASGSYWN